MEETHRENPYDSASVISRVFLCWIFPLFVKGRKKNIEEKDLYKNSKYHDSESLGNLLQREWEKEMEKKNPQLVKAILRFIGWSFLKYLSILFIQEIFFLVLQAELIGITVEYFSNTSENENYYGYFSVTGICVIITIQSIILSIYIFKCEEVSLRIKIATCCIIYRKGLRLSCSSLAKSNIGQMVNLLANDISKFYIYLYTIGYLFTTPLMLITGISILWKYFGYGIIIGMSVVFIYVPIQSTLGKVYSIIRLKMAKATDERLTLLNELIAGIRVIKMFTWELPFASEIENARKKEIKYLRQSLYCRGISFSLAPTISKLIMLISVATIILRGGYLNIKLIFVTFFLLDKMQNSSLSIFPFAISQIAELYASINRIQKFMLLDEKNDERIKDKDEIHQINRNGIYIRNVVAAWEKNMEPTLRKISLTVQPGELVTVIGPVGSGKTSFLMSILREIPIISGEVLVKGKISYASQEAWIFSGSIRENILFGKDYEENKYKQVLYVSALEKDLDIFPDGDLTLVGERGRIMSGGQKARINLARALYLEADIFLLDDPLSAVDAPVAKHIFQKCIMEYLKDKICILVTHQIQFLQSASRIVIIDQGICRAIGDYNNIMNLDTNKKYLTKEDNITDDDIDSLISSLDKRTTSADKYEEIPLNPEKSSQTHPDQEAKNVEPGKEEKKNEATQLDSSIGTYREFAKSTTGYGVYIILFLVFIVTQTALNGCDLWLLKWSMDEGIDIHGTGKISNSSFHTGNNSANSSSFLEKRNFNLYVYCGFIGSLFVLSAMCIIVFYEIMFKSSTIIHSKMLRCIIRTPMSFMDINPAGQVLSRFSKDIGGVDEILPFVGYIVLRSYFSVIGIFVINAIITPYMLITDFIVVVLYCWIWSVFSKVLKTIRYLEGVRRSPTFSHLSNSLYGLTTIRAFNVEKDFKIAFDKYQNDHSSMFFIMIAISRWVSLYSQIIATLNLIFVCILTISIISVNTGGYLGLCIIYGLAIINVSQYNLRHVTEISFQVRSTRRILDYTNLNSEAPLKSSADKAPPLEWPTKGDVKFEQVSLKYSKEKYPVLKNITFHIENGEKIGVVGRTGAGKSSLVAALFRMAEPTGEICIDGIVTKDIGLHELRAILCIIPQDPLLFTGPLRRNLDLFNEFSDDNLWRVLEDVYLKDVVVKLPGGLNACLSEGGRNFSVGQRQLICLGRAILRKSKILILDEATSNIDKVTDSCLQKIIRDKFSACTVLTIAHRLQTIIDSDRILVVDNGEILEFDKPYELLKNKKGVFYNMVQKTGKITTKELYKIAREQYVKNDCLTITKL